MAVTTFDIFRDKVAKGLVDLSAGTIKHALMASGYTPDATTANFGAINSDEASCTGYTAGFGGTGRQAIANRVLTNDTTNHKEKLSYDSLSWPGLSGATIVGLCELFYPAGAATDADVIPMFYRPLASPWVAAGALTLTINGSDGALQII